MAIDLESTALMRLTCEEALRRDPSSRSGGKEAWLNRAIDLAKPLHALLGELVGMVKENGVP